jgi:hypothetical protein
VSERGLKRLAIHAKRAFDDEVKAGTRVPLTPDELEMTEAEREALDEARAMKGTKNKNKGRPTGVKQAKVVRQTDRVDVLTGKGRSKGYGFIEMDTHPDALRVLRWLNNNHEAHKLLWAWWRDEVTDLTQAGQEQLKALNADGATSKSRPDESTKVPQVDPKNAAVRKEELETRVKKLEARAAQMKVRDSEASIKDGRALHVEFSVENITVVKRRREKEVMRTSEADRPLPVKVCFRLNLVFNADHVLFLELLSATSRSDRHRTIEEVQQHQNALRRKRKWTSQRVLIGHRIMGTSPLPRRGWVPPLAASSGRSVGQGSSQLGGSDSPK